MRRSRATAQRSRRRSAPFALRSLAALVALLLVGSALGQVAHFLLVQHAVCAEHGELLELHAGPHAPAQAAERHEASERDRASTPAHEAEHDHCQVLARREREQALPSVSVSAGDVPSAMEPLPPAYVRAAGAGASRLSVAPKTSPPRHVARG